MKYIEPLCSCKDNASGWCYLDDPGLWVRDELLTKIVDSHCLWPAWLPQLHSICPPRLLLARLDIIHLIITKPRTSEKRLRDGINETKLCLMFPIWFL